MSPKISAGQQKLILERLEHSHDSVQTYRNFREQHGSAIGDFGQRDLRAYDVMHILKRAGYSEIKIKKAMRETVGEEYIVDLK